MQEFSASHPSLAPPLSPVSLSADSWAMAIPGCSDNWKAWWLAICESEWFGECCVCGRVGRGLCESQTASRGELLTPHRCQRTPRWPFAEQRLLMRKRMIIPPWGKHKHVVMNPDNSNKKAKSSRNMVKALVFKMFRRKPVPVQTQVVNSSWRSHCCYIPPRTLFAINQHNCRWKIYDS